MLNPVLGLLALGLLAEPPNRHDLPAERPDGPVTHDIARPGRVPYPVDADVDRDVMRTASVRIAEEDQVPGLLVGLGHVTAEVDLRA